MSEARQYRGPSTLIAGAVLLSAVSTTQAQELEEVVVTATRVAQDINKVPISITAFSTEQMDQQHIVAIDDLAAATPGLQFHATSGGTVTEISIRGIQSNIGDGTTGIYIDDTPIQVRKAGLSFTATNAYPKIFDIDRVEVLRGPQGTLFGSGSMGGAVRFVTPQTSLTEYSLYTRDEASYTVHGSPSVETGISLGGPIIQDTLGVRLSMHFRHDGGFIDQQPRADIVARLENTDGGLGQANASPVAHDVNYQDSSSIRLSLAYQPLEHLTIAPSIYYEDTYFNSTGEYWDYFSNPSQGQYLNADTVNSPTHDHWILPALNVKYDFGAVSLISNSSYFNRNERDAYDCTVCTLQLSPLGPQLISPLQFLPNLPHFGQQAYDLNSQANLTQEIRVQSNSSSRFAWVAGAFFQQSRATNQDFVPIDAATFTAVSQALGALQNPPLTFGSYSDLFYGASLLNGIQSYQTLDLVHERQYAGFGDVTFEVIDGLKLNAGVRVTHLNIQATSLQGGPFAGTSDMEGFSAGQAESSTTPKGSISYQINNGSMVYGTVSKGFRGGGVNQPLPASCDEALTEQGLTGSPQQYRSDSLVSYEFGTKNRLFDNRLNLSASVFLVKWNDIQQAIQLGVGCNRAIVVNANSATSKGFDVQTDFAATEALTFHGSVSYTKATYDSALQGSPDAVTGIRPTIVNKGDTLDGVVPWSVVAGGAYKATVLDHETTLRLQYEYSSRQHEPTVLQDPMNAGYLPYSRFIPTVSQLNASYGVKFGKADVSAFVNNLTDAHPSIQTEPGDQFDSRTESYTIRPRTIGLVFTYRY